MDSTTHDDDQEIDELGINRRDQNDDDEPAPTSDNENLNGNVIMTVLLILACVKDVTDVRYHRSDEDNDTGTVCLELAATNSSHQ